MNYVKRFKSPLKKQQQHTPHPLLEAMHNMTKATDDLVEKARPIKERQEEIRAIAEIFKGPENLEKMSPDERDLLKFEKMAQLAAKRDDFYNRSKKTGDDATWARKGFRITNSWAPNLFTFVAVPDMPSTNNSTEQKFGHT